MTEAVAWLIDRYRGDAAGAEPVLRSDLDVAAYAAYRMSATYAAVRSALGQFA